MTLTLNGIHNASVIKNGLMLILSLLWQLKHLQLGYTVPIVTIKCNNQGIGQGLILRCFIEEGNYCLRMIAITNCWAWNHAREAQKLTSRLFSAFFSMQNCSRVVCQPVVGTLNMNCSYVLSFAYDVRFRDTHVLKISFFHFCNFCQIILKNSCFEIILYLCGVKLHAATQSWPKIRKNSG